MKIRTARTFILGVVVGLAITTVSAVPEIYRYEQHRNVAIAAARTERDACVQKLAQDEKVYYLVTYGR